jgi:two-component system response regulator (stage 0 sporulation protein A)
MQTKKIIVLETSGASWKEWKEALESTGNYTLIYVTDDGEEGIERAIELKPDLVLVNMFLKGTDGCGVIRALKKEVPKLKILAMGNAGDQIVERAIVSGADYYLVKPFSTALLLERINELLGEEELLKAKYSTIAKRKPVTTEEKISDIFIAIGIPPHIKGYGYLREGIKTTVEKPQIINNVTKELYPSIAEKYETTPSKVERAIRHAIEVAWNRGRVDAISAVFGTRVYLGGEKPTNSEFIALVADKLILENMG